MRGVAEMPRINRCIHCLNEFPVVEMNDDHVFPKSWYPSSTDHNLERWVVPSCIPCNQTHGRNEEDLLIRLSLCVGSNDPSCAGISERGLRAINPSFARNNRDRTHRLGKLQKIMREILVGDAIPDFGAHPDFPEILGIPRQNQFAITISEESIKMLGKKIARGIYYLQHNLYIEDPYKVEIYTENEEGSRTVMEMIRRFGQEYTREPGISVYVAITPEDEMSSIFRIEIWNKWKMFGSVFSQTVLDSWGLSR